MDETERMELHHCSNGSNDDYFFTITLHAHKQKKKQEQQQEKNTSMKEKDDDVMMMVAKKSELSWQGWMKPMIRQLHGSVGAISIFMTKWLFHAI